MLQWFRKKINEWNINLLVYLLKIVENIKIQLFHRVQLILFSPAGETSSYVTNAVTAFKGKNSGEYVNYEKTFREHSIDVQAGVGNH